MLLSSAKVVTPYRTLSNELTSKRRPPPRAAPPVLSDVRCHTALTTNAAQRVAEAMNDMVGTNCFS